MTDKSNVLDSIAKSRSGKASAKARVVFTNGCFDILHVGHIRYLAEAKKLGDLLVVGLNSDASTKRLKGAARPVVTESERAEMLLALRAVDFVVTFDEDTPLELIQEIRPDFLVKGGDWTPDKIVGADFVQSYGGKVLSIPFHPGHSTTGLVEKIKKL
ncbi:D-glycero-beta-D-manno-heptose 1-phosphate adenylyltransferase [bacterium]|nr:D-glycero-beta-D-manno-heptose 1-phosphate adenylyltransferase [bacterium]